MKPILAALLTFSFALPHVHAEALTARREHDLFEALTEMHGRNIMPSKMKTLATLGATVAVTPVFLNGLIYVYPSAPLKPDQILQRNLRNVGHAASGAGLLIGTLMITLAFTEQLTHWMKLHDGSQDYETREGLEYFFELPVIRQFHIAKEDPQFADYLISLNHLTTELDQGYRPEKARP